MLFTIGLLCAVVMIGFAAKIIRKSKETSPTVNLHPEVEPTIPAVEVLTVEEEEPVKIEATVEVVTTTPPSRPVIKAKKKPTAKKTNKPK